MALNKTLEYLRKPLVIGVLALTLLLSAPLAVPTFRAEFLAALAVDEELLDTGDETSAATPEAQDNNPFPNAPSRKKKPNLFKRIVTSPFRMISRAFRGDSDQERLAKANHKAAADFPTLPVIRTRDGMGSEVARDVPPDVPLDAIPASTISRIQSGALSPGAVLSNETRADQTAALMYGEAVDLHLRGQIDNALEKLTAVVTLRPKHAEAHNLLGICFDQKGLYGFAHSSYERAIKLQPGNSRFLNNLGYSYYLSGDNKEALHWYKKALKRTPEDRRLHNNLGLTYGRLGDINKSLEHFTRSVGPVAARLNLGFVLNQQGRYEDAIREYETALRGQPDSLAALAPLVKLYERTGRLREAAYASEMLKKQGGAQTAQQTK
ncbi:MAG: tetratricopeptide repeat protein [Blastocatellia bacterium]